nr:hypothetical protein BaRGS_013514 [Batillaria attramentaria]
MRTQSDAIAQTGLKMARLMLHPKQIELVKQTTPPSVFLIGPPGTGKSVVLAMKGLVWRKERRHVHLISSHSDSRAANILLKHQLVRSLDEDGSMVHLHMFDFGNATELETSVEKLSAAARHGSLFDTFCSKLKQRVPDLHLWAAAMQQDNIPEFFSVERLTVPLRNPPAVLREVERSRFIVNGDVDGYTSSAIPAPTDGLQIHWIRHKGEKLRYRDVFVLCDYPSDDLPFVKAMNVPVQALPVWGDEDAIEDVALAKSDQVTVTEWRTVSGLERKVVIGMGPVSGDIELGSRLSSMSRCLAKLIWIESD